MIINNYCADELVGLFAKVKKPLVGKNKKTAPAGAIVIVRCVADKRTKKFVNVTTIPCQHCGQFSVIERVECDSLEVIDPLPFNLPMALTDGRKIPRKMTADELVGKLCRVTHHVQNGGGQGISPRTVCKIAAAHYGVHIQADKCLICGQTSYISGIKRDDVLLIDT